MRVKYLAKEHNTMNRPGLQPASLDPTQGAEESTEISVKFNRFDAPPFDLVVQSAVRDLMLVMQSCYASGVKLESSIMPTVITVCGFPQLDA